MLDISIPKVLAIFVPLNKRNFFRSSRDRIEAIIVTLFQLVAA